MTKRQNLRDSNMKMYAAQITMAYALTENRSEMERALELSTDLCYWEINDILDVYYKEGK